MVTKSIPEIAKRYNLEEAMLRNIQASRVRTHQIALRRLAYGTQREPTRHDPYRALANQLRGLSSTSSQESRL